MERSVAIDSYKLMWWLNARKLTLDFAARSIGIDPEKLGCIKQSDVCDFSSDQVERLARCLNVDAHQLSPDDRAQAQVIVMTRREMEATRRPIHRDGIHFYNYYSLPAPKGKVGPVILDILCPACKLPQLNNGHLEPAITVNIGPGHINGRWGEELTHDTWDILAANKTDREPWILGDSYTEPSYCRHTYSLVNDEPARIISYTIKSALQSFLFEANTWSDGIFEKMLEILASGASAATILSMHMERRGYDTATLADAVSLSANSITAYIGGDMEALSLADLRAIGCRLGVDYRLFLPVVHTHDKVGKTYCSVEESIRSIRHFRGYTVASLAGATTESDLLGLYMKVDKPDTNETLDLIDHGPTHYFVTMGAVSLHVSADQGRTAFRLEEGDAVWVGAFVQHAFFGRGALIKLGNGEGSSYLDQVQLGNTFNLPATLARGRRDRGGWGYQ